MARDHVVPENAGLARLDGESKLNHRALVLYAMQDESRRSRTAAADGVQRTEGALRLWSARWKWEARIAHEGVSVQARACQLYRELYHGEWRLRDVAGPVEQRMTVPVLAMSAPPKAGQPGEGTAEKLAQAKTLQDAPRQAPELSDRDRAVRALRAQRSIVEEAIKAFAERFAKGATRPIVTVADADRMMRAHREISELLGDLAPPTATPTAMETSFRVREAERLGRPVTQALLEDVAELGAILTAIRDSEERDPSWLEVAQAPAQDSTNGRKARGEREEGEAAGG